MATSLIRTFIVLYYMLMCRYICTSHVLPLTSTDISSTILLHDPHADVRKAGCLSALKMLNAARAILDLIYVVWSTSYDITLMDLSCTVICLLSRIQCGPYSLASAGMLVSGRPGFWSFFDDRAGIKYSRPPCDFKDWARVYSVSAVHCTCTGH